MAGLLNILVGLAILQLLKAAPFDGLPLNTYAATFDKRMMKLKAKQCAVIYQATKPSNPRYYKRLFQHKGTIEDHHQVLFEVYRHEPKEVSGLVIMTGGNNFAVVFAGAKSNADSDALLDYFEVPRAVESLKRIASPRMRELFGVRVHAGFATALSPFMESFSEQLAPFVEPEQMITIELTGYGFGGALAQLAALHLKSTLHIDYAISPQQVLVQVSTFGAACPFDHRDLHVAEGRIDKMNAVNFFCAEDLTTELTLRLGLRCAGYSVVLRDDPVQCMTQQAPTMNQWEKRQKSNLQSIPSCYPETETQLVRLYRRRLLEAVETSKDAKVDVMTEKEFRRFRREVNDFLWNLRLEHYIELDAVKVEVKLEKRRKAMLKKEDRRLKKNKRTHQAKPADPKLSAKQAAWDRRWEERTKLKLEARLLRKRGMDVSKPKYSKRLGKRPSQLDSYSSSSSSSSSTSFF
jgi:hypothetical protein